MGAISIRNLPDAVHEALRQRAAAHGRSTEAEVRAILTEAVMPPVLLGDALYAIGRAADIRDEDMWVFERDRTAWKPVTFD